MSEKVQKAKKGKQQVDRFTEAMLPETDERVRNAAGIFMILAAAAAFWLSTMEIVVDEIMFEDAEGEELTASMKMEEKKEEKKEKKKEKNKKKRKKAGGGGKQRGKGTPNAPQTRGVLKMLTTKTSKSGFSAYSLMKDQNFAKDISKVLSNVAGLQKTGKTKIGGRRGTANGAFNSGYAEGGSGGIGDMLGGLLGGGGGAISTSAKGKIRPPSSRDIDMGSGGGTRSKSSIMRVVRARTPGLRHVYNKFLKSNPGFSGKVTLRFTISPSGKIIKISKVSSTTGVSGFDSAIKNKVRMWKFEKIKSGNTTVTIPFTFTE